MEIIITYLIAFAPFLFSLVSGLIVDACRKHGMKKAIEAVEVAQTKFNEFTNSNDVKELITQNKVLINALCDAKKAETLAVEELTKIHKAHPEWFETKEG